jgi:hypothetical protein
MKGDRRCAEQVDHGQGWDQNEGGPVALCEILHLLLAREKMNSPRLP